MMFKNINSCLSTGVMILTMIMISKLALAQPMNLTLDNQTIVSAEVHSATNTLTLGPEINVNASGSLTVGAPNVYILPKLNVLKGGKLYIVTSPVDVANEALINPFGLNVSQAYPNPFQQSVRIDYTLEKSGKVDILVYDGVGKVVRRLISDYQFPGKHDVSWDGTTSSGNKVSHGIYYIRFVTESYQITQKAIFME